MPEIMIAARPGMVVIDGKRRMVRKGVTTAHATHPIVTGHPKLWRPLKVDYPAVSAARGGRKEAGGQQEVDNAAVRAWASGQGIEVAPYGRIAAGIIEQYRAAQASPDPQDEEPDDLDDADDDLDEDAEDEDLESVGGPQ